MVKYNYGTEFKDIKTTVKLKIVNYDDCADCYICKDKTGHTFFRTEEEVEKAIKGETAVKTFSLDSLSSEELLALRNGVMREIEHREEEKRSDLWDEVVKAVENYLKSFGEILINVDDGDAEYSIDDISQLKEYSGGIIMV